MYGGLAGAFTDGVKDGYAFVDKAKAAQDEAQKRKMNLEKQKMELSMTEVAYQDAMGGNAGAQPQQDAMAEVQKQNADLQKQVKKSNGANMDMDLNGLNAQKTIKDRDEYLKTLNSKIKNNPAMYSSLQLKGNVEVLNRANTTDMTWMTENLRSMDVTPESLDLNLEDEADQEIWGKVMDKAVDIYPYAKEGENRVNLDHMGIATGAVSRAIPAVRKELEKTNDGRAFELERVVQEHRTAIAGEEHRMANDGYISGEPQQPYEDGTAETLPTEKLAETLPTEELAETLPITEPFAKTDTGAPVGITTTSGATVTSEGLVDAEGNKVKQPIPVTVPMEELGIKQDPATSVKTSGTPRKQTNQIVIHQTGGNFNEKAPERNKNGTSAHYTITKEGEIYQHLDDGVVGAHAKGNNSNSIGIELESDIYNEENGYEDPTEAQAKALENLTGNLAGKYNLDSSHVVAHPDINNKMPTEGVAGRKIAKDYLDSLDPASKKEVEAVAEATGKPVETVAQELVSGKGETVEVAKDKVADELISNKPDIKKIYALLGKKYPEGTTKMQDYEFLVQQGTPKAVALDAVYGKANTTKKSTLGKLYEELDTARALGQTDRVGTIETMIKNTVDAKGNTKSKIQAQNATNQNKAWEDAGTVAENQTQYDLNQEIIEGFEDTAAIQTMNDKLEYSNKAHELANKHADVVEKSYKTGEAISAKAEGDLRRAQELLYKTADSKTKEADDGILDGMRANQVASKEIDTTLKRMDKGGDLEKMEKGVVDNTLQYLETKVTDAVIPKSREATIEANIRAGSVLGYLQATLIRAMSGTAASEAEVKRLQDVMQGDNWNQPDKLRIALDEFRDGLIRQQGTLRGQLRVSPHDAYKLSDMGSTRPTPAPTDNGKVVKRTGTRNGKTVIEYMDGSERIK